MDKPCKVKLWRHFLTNSLEKKSVSSNEKQPQNTSAHHSSDSIKAVASFEITKGTAAILFAMLLWLWHDKLMSWLLKFSTEWTGHFGQLFSQQIDNLIKMAEKANHNWELFVFLISGYATLRFIEAYGLWRDRNWAYWYSVLGYGIFIPIELYYLIKEPFDWFHLFIFILNIVIVIVVYRNMKKKGLIK